MSGVAIWPSVEECLRLDFDEPAGIDKPVDHDDPVRRADLGEDVPMGAGCFPEVGGRRQVEAPLADADQLAHAQAQEFEQVAQRRRRENCSDDCSEPGDRERHEPAETHSPADEP